jgi:hypothetical protein
VGKQPPGGRCGWQWQDDQSVKFNITTTDRGLLTQLRSHRSSWRTYTQFKRTPWQCGRHGGGNIAFRAQTKRWNRLKGRTKPSQLTDHSSCPSKASPPNQPHICSCTVVHPCSNPVPSAATDPENKKAAVTATAIEIRIALGPISNERL